MKRELSASEYLNLLNSMTTFAAIFDRDGRLRFINRIPLLKSLGYEEEEVIGTPIWECLHFKRVVPLVKEAFERALKGESVQIEIEAIKRDGSTFPMLLNLGPLRENGEITGVVAEAKSVKEQRELERKLRETIEKLKAAQEELLTPIAQIWDNILLMPLIGVIDSYRAQKIMEALLDKIVKTRAEYVILDISGVASVDTEVANHLIKTVRAANLLGCTCIVTGIRPEVAQTMTHIGIKFDIVTKRDVQDGLMFCLKRMGYDMKKAE